MSQTRECSFRESNRADHIVFGDDSDATRDQARASASHGRKKQSSHQVSAAPLRLTYH
jgi:hypothetical protein